jgi:hypothetical protein
VGLHLAHPTPCWFLLKISSSKNGIHQPAYPYKYRNFSQKEKYLSKLLPIVNIFYSLPKKFYPFFKKHQKTRQKSLRELYRQSQKSRLY